MENTGRLKRIYLVYIDVVLNTRYYYNDIKYCLCFAHTYLNCGVLLVRLSILLKLHSTDILEIFDQVTITSLALHKNIQYVTVITLLL